MRDHGGNLDDARALFGDGNWIDLSTGINRLPYPVPELPQASFTDLPTKAALSALIDAARAAYGTSGDIVPLAGAQAGIQLLPRLLKPGLARVLAPTYNEHAASLIAAGWRVETVIAAEALAGADLAVIVNPNNPDGRLLPPATLLGLHKTVGALVVDESFMDATPEIALTPQAGLPGLYILRSFGKFYGLAGLRLGFVLGAAPDLEPLRELAGPWPLSGPAIEIGTKALRDSAWQRQTAARLAGDAARLDALMPFALVGGTSLFRLYETPDAAKVQAHLARHRIWSRIFPANPRWLRLGLPGEAHEWQQLETALGSPA